jgi:hypothetical protein
MLSSIYGMKMKQDDAETQQVNEMLRMMLTGKELDLAQQKFAIDKVYKQALTDQAKASAEESRAKKVTDMSPIEVPGVGPVTLDVWKSLPADEKSYALAVHQAKLLGDDSFMSKEAWAKLQPTEQGKFLQELIDNPELKDIKIDIAKAGATTIGDVVGRESAKAKVKSKAYFSDPKGLVKDVQAHINSEEVQNKLFEYVADPKTRAIETARAAENFIRRQIAAAEGTIIDARVDKPTKAFIFTVKWPDDSTSEVKYVN